MGNDDYACPRCNSRHVIDLKDNIQCSNCHQEFSKKDLDRLEKDQILSISEKQEFIRIFTDKTEDLF